MGWKTPLPEENFYLIVVQSRCKVAQKLLPPVRLFFGTGVLPGSVHNKKSSHTYTHARAFRGLIACELGFLPFKKGSLCPFV